MQTNEPNNQVNGTLSKITGQDAQGITNFINATVIAPTLNLGLAGLKFSIRKEESVSSESEITDHYLENNTPVQQHVASKPLMITLTGEIHEFTITDLANNSTGILQDVVEKLTPVVALLPSASQTAKNTKKAIATTTAGNSSAADIASSSAQASYDIYSLYKNALSLTTQQGKIAQFLEALKQSKTTLGVDTQLGYYTNMIIQSWRMTARDNTTQISDVEVTLKQLRFTSTIAIPFDSTEYQDRLQKQAQVETDAGKGNATPTPTRVQSLLGAGWEEAKKRANAIKSGQS